MFYNKFPDDKFDITTTLVKKLTMKSKKRDPSTNSLIISTSTPSIIPSLIKYYLYKINMAWMHTKTIIYNTILSQSPDTYMEVTRSKEDHPSFWNNSYYLEIGYLIYK